MNKFKAENFNWRKIKSTPMSKAAQAAFKDIRADKDVKAWAQANNVHSLPLKEDRVIIF